MSSLKNDKIIPGSFRDPCGFLFSRDGLLYRQINAIYKGNYDHLMASGLYQALTDSGLLLPHEEVVIDGAIPQNAYKVIRPEEIPFISYPYEWCFSQLKDAALLTLKIQKTALNFGMSLRDCSVYNIQFKKGKPVFIDTLSFEKYCQGQPWKAYGQFCSHFLAPLALMSNKDIRINQLLRVYLDGIPLDLASSLLPLRTRFIFSLFLHIHLHAKMQKHFADKPLNIKKAKVTKLSFLALIDSLESAVKRLKWGVGDSMQRDYYRNITYSQAGFEHKKQTVGIFLDKINPKIVWDIGANVGLFSRIASDKGAEVISFDNDPLAVEKNYLQCILDNETKVLPLLADIVNPSPAIGWVNKERMSLLERGPADTVLALALVHHLAISHNLPFPKIVDFFNATCNSLIIEFVPKEDPQAQRLLSTRKDIFPDYTQGTFEREFENVFAILDSAKMRDSGRIIYLMRKKKTD